MARPRTHSDGRLRSRPRAQAGAVPLAPGLHPLSAVGLPDHLVVVPDDPTAPDRLLVWFHGAGGNGRASASALQAVAQAHRTLVLLPSSSGSTWDLLTGRTGEDVAALDAALEHVLSTATVSSCAFAGFSDGASYALSLGFANGDLAEAVLAFSPGFAAPPDVVGRPRCFVAHGTADAVLPIDRCGRRVVARLERDGYPVVHEEFEGGHVVRPDDLDRPVQWWQDGGPEW